MYVEIIPSEIADVMRESFEHVAERSRLINDTIGYETLHDAIIVAENIGTRLLCYVEPQDLFFVFGQTVQSLGYAPIEFPLAPPRFNEREYVRKSGYGEEGNSNNEGKPKHGAVVLCKLKYADELEKFLSDKEQEGSHNSKSYKIAWCELQELKKSFGYFRNHIDMPNETELRGLP